MYIYIYILIIQHNIEMQSKSRTDYNKHQIQINLWGGGGGLRPPHQGVGKGCANHSAKSRVAKDATALQTGLSLRSRKILEIGPLFLRVPLGEIAFPGPAGEPENHFRRGCCRRAARRGGEILKADL